PGSADRTAQKRKFPSPPHSSNGHLLQDTSTSPIKNKKKPSLLSSNSKKQVRPRLGVAWQWAHQRAAMLRSLEPGLASVQQAALALPVICMCRKGSSEGPV
ncbi:Hypothetical predicted protein, partial [Marmota monax]